MKYKILKTRENATAYKETHCLLAFNVSVEKFNVKVFMENKLYARNVNPVKLTHDSNIPRQSKLSKLTI